MAKAEQMFSLVEAQKSSGLGARAYSESLGIKFATFQYWCKRYRDWKRGHHGCTANGANATEPIHRSIPEGYSKNSTYNVALVLLRTMIVVIPEARHVKLNETMSA
jgi:hypothetical protein